MMHKVLMVAFAGSLFAQGAAVNAQSIDWSGAYIGLTAGHGRNSSQFDDTSYNGGIPGFPPYSFDVDTKGAQWGIFGGYNWQRDTQVYGVELEIGRSEAEGSAFPPFNDPFGDPYDAAGGVEAGWYGTLAGRLGVVRDKSLFYGKLGLAYSDARATFVDTCTAAPCGPGVIDASGALGWGLLAGIGIDHALSEKWVLRAEYEYIHFGSADASGDNISPGMPNVPTVIGGDMSSQRLKLGISFKF
ncbi:outer membrane beta-barrel protein [Xinfangfangia sp. CPCC 101601]|uniref:Outer membrane beta-barrel protein n=1 Tax=Pseudogemmobacter lacusdianii TaxID=3069608 RepID=A0ABU0VSP7_9RHOB|nr:outer membrane beta-barrel protein [Xinfangfangia sp. CPCC 101601]MDQ2064751.1 outer membrane beta-barrel protein [Xinfangfangia sp. CPCC 101601]